MGGKSSLDKGKRGEREVVKLLQPVVDEVYGSRKLQPPKIQRNTLQSDSGGYDLTGIAFLALEVKFCEQLSINNWWLQTVAQTKYGQDPVLFYRQSRRPWKVVTEVSYARKLVRATLDLDDFLTGFRRKLENEIRKSVRY